ncbi:MAG: class I SAM-dependent methyltransferase [Beijerinckiaceae bacterium]
MTSIGDRLSRSWRALTSPPDLPHSAQEHFAEYVTSYPSPQNAIDALPGWNQAFPWEMNLAAGHMALYNDPRILWAIEQFGDISGRRVLEIGPLEGWHTYMLDKHAPAVLDAVEANRVAYLRCLVVKEIMGLRHARFHLGDCQAWLEQPDNRYDLIVASGILYHMRDPVRFLAAAAKQADSLFLWTHYADDASMPPGDVRRGAFVGSEELVEHLGVTVRLQPRSYYGASANDTFCGGTHDLHRWINRGSLLEVLAAMGLTDQRIWGEQPDHPNGPAFCVFARRPVTPEHAASSPTEAEAATG